MAEEDVISNVWTFRLLARMRAEEADVRAGSTVRRHATQTSARSARDRRSAGSGLGDDSRGLHRRADRGALQQAGVGPAAGFLAAFLSERIVVDGTPTKNLEGFLFPSTYLVRFGSAPDQAASQFTTEFFKELPADAALARGRWA